MVQVLERYEVTGLLHLTWQCEEETLTRYVGRGRGGPQRPTRTEVRVRYIITAVQRDTAAIQQHTHRLGWRVQVTNGPVERLSLAQAVVHYRGGWCLERDFHLLKDRPLGISPLYVRRDDQIVGLTRLLTLALRMLTLIETSVRQGLVQAGEQLATAGRLLKAVARTEITLTQIRMGRKRLWHLTPLSPLVERVLAYLGLSASLYRRLAENSS